MDPSQLARFETLMLPHLDAAVTLARYLLRDPHDADDAVQDAYLKAVRHFDGFRGGDARAWLLTIVRNACHTAWRKRSGSKAEPFDDEQHSETQEEKHPETDLLRAATGEMVRAALDALPLEFREAMVLREIQGLSYKEIAEVTAVPVGTVMSRLARARQRLTRILTAREARP